MSRPRSWLRSLGTRVAGTATGSALVLVLLGAGASFAAAAIPGERSTTQSSALRARIAQDGVSASTLLATGDYHGLRAALAAAAEPTTLSPGQMALPQAALASRLAALGVPLASGPASSWTALVCGELPAQPAARSAGRGAATPIKIAPTYRSDLARQSTLLEGTFPDADQLPAGSSDVFEFDVAVTAATAASLHVSVHDKITIPADTASFTPPLVLTVTGIVRPVDAAAPYWTEDPLAADAHLNIPLGGPPFWESEMFVGPNEATDLTEALQNQDPSLFYGVGLDLGSVTADQAPGLIAGLTAAQSAAQALPLPAAASAGSTPTAALQLSGGPLSALRDFVHQRQTIDSLLDLVLGSLGALGSAVLLLCLWLFTVRRTEELELLRVRGASGRQLAGLSARIALAGVLPCVVGFALALVLVPGARRTPSSWWLPAAAAALALAGPAAAVTGNSMVLIYRRRRRGAGVRSGEPVRRARFRAMGGDRRPAGRVVGYSTLVLLCGGALAALRAYGDAAGGPIAIFAPFLLAVTLAAGIRFLTPVAMRAVSRVAAKRGGTVFFVASARAARGVPAALGPSFVLVLALAVVALASMVRGTVTAAEVSASWTQTGTDARITAPAGGFSSTAVDALEHVGGVSRAVAARILSTSSFTLGSGQGVAPADTVLLVVDPARYRTLTAGTPVAQLPGEPAGAGRGHTVFASPQVASGLGDSSTLTLFGRSITVTVAAAGPDTAALPATPDFVIVPQDVLPAAALAVNPVNTVLLDGPIDRTKLADTVRRQAPGSAVVLRGDALAALAASPFQAGTLELAGYALIGALVLALVGVLAGAALTARSRETALAHLATLGLTERQGLLLVCLEALPGLVAAIAGGVVCTVATSLIVGSSVDLSVFTGLTEPVRLRAAPGALALAAGAIAVTALLAQGADALSARRRGVTAALRVGDQ